MCLVALPANPLYSPFPEGYDAGRASLFYSFRQTRSAANSTTAFDKIFIASATTLSKAAGLAIVGLAGHLTTTAFGRSLPASTNSMVRVWPLRLPWIAALRWTSGGLLLGRCSPRPWSAATGWGHLCVVGLGYLAQIWQ
jgi:hypothetical protein